MLNYDFRYDFGILVLKPEGPLEAADFKALAGRVDAYLDRHGKLRGVMLYARVFPGWKDLGALAAHLQFVRLHHHRIEKVAVVADGGIASVMPRIARYFLDAEVRNFDLCDVDAAWNWLTAHTHARVRCAA